GGCARTGTEAAELRHQADHRRRDRRAAADCRYLLRTQAAAKEDQHFRRNAKVRFMSIVQEPPANILWFLPTHGDGRYLGTTTGARQGDLPYLRQIAQAADDLGYFGVLLPTGRSCEDSWVVASALAPLTERLRFLVAVRPGLLTPTLAARMTGELHRISSGRLLINVVTGGDPVENKGDGIFLPHAERYEVTREFLDVYAALLEGKTVDYKGEHIAIEDGRLLFQPLQKPRP